MQDETWRTRIEGLMSIFRDSLLALIPHLEAARIPRHEKEAYDEWDNICEALFENIILRSLRWGMASGGADVVVPTYGHVHRDYGDRALIELIDSDPQDAPEWVFFRLGSEESPLDTVMCLRLAQDGKTLTDEMRRVPFAKAHYRVWLRDDDRLRGPISELRIELSPV